MNILDIIGGILGNSVKLGYLPDALDEITAVFEYQGISRLTASEVPTLRKIFRSEQEEKIPTQRQRKSLLLSIITQMKISVLYKQLPFSILAETVTEDRSIQ